VVRENDGQRLALIGGRPVELFDATTLLAGAPALSGAES